MSIDLLKNWDPYKYLSKNERKNISLQEFNDEFEKAKINTKNDILQLEEDNLKELNDNEEIRFKNNQVSSLLEFNNIKDKWSEYMFNIIKKTVSCNFNYSSIELIYLFLTIIIMICVYFFIYSLYFIIKNNNKKNNDYNINVFVNKIKNNK